jgi:hypothetical protein
MVAQQLERDGEVRRAALPIALAVGALLGVLLWKVRERILADRPIIMTGGSFHVWGLKKSLRYEGPVGPTHIYRNEYASGLRKVVVRCGSDREPYDDVSKVEIRYGSSLGAPNIVLTGCTLSIETGSSAEPLTDRGSGKVKDPDTDKWVTASHQEWTDPGGEIMSVTIWCGAKGPFPVPCAPGDRPRLKVYTT